MRASPASTHGRLQRAHLGAVLFTLSVGVAVVVAFGHVDLGSVALADEAPPVTTSSTPPVVPSPVPELFHSRWYTQSVDPDLTVGEVADITVQFRNVGHTPWVRRTAAEIRLGEVAGQPLPPAMRVDWPYYDRPAIQSEAVVHERGLVTFSFKVRGVAPGLFRLRLRPVVDGLTWLDDDGVHVDITVRRAEIGRH